MVHYLVLISFLFIFLGLIFIGHRADLNTSREMKGLDPKQEAEKLWDRIFESLAPHQDKP